MATYITSTEIRQKFKQFFESKGHTWIPSASLVPKNDPSVLFTTAGMHPLVPYLLGEPHPLGKRLANIQRCLRTDDIDEVGDETHLTFFEMLGFWSLGDYFKEASIPYTWELFTSTEGLGLDPGRMAVTVFAGDADAPFDHEAEELWLAQPGFPGKHRIARMSKADNWWPTGGGSGGPCGPDTEIFYWSGSNEAPPQFDPKNKAWVEIGNNVFMQYNRKAGGSYVPLAQRNVDTGLGFERIVTMVQGKPNVFETDLFAPIIDAIRSKTQLNSLANQRVIADHLRAVVFLAMDAVAPSNKDQGYVMRRLIRRAMIKWQQLEPSSPLIEAIAPVIIELYRQAYPILGNLDLLMIPMLKEEDKLARTLSDGLKMVHRFADQAKGRNVTGAVMFQLFTSYGIPTELQPELFKDVLPGATFELDEYDRLFKEHQQKSRVSAGQKFKGGLADTSERVIRMHTATHLLHEALLRILGPHVEQRGSNITSERLRFDFVHPQKMTDQEIKQTEELVSDIIKQDLPVQREVLSREEALHLGARAIFGEKYGDQVSVYSIGPDEAGNYFSREFCGGPHVTHTGQIGPFSILKEEASSAGIRRIKASVA